MIIHLLRSPANPTQIKEMLKTLESYIKVAVDIRQGILAGGGVMHADCEAKLLDSGSKQADIWGGDWKPSEKEVTFQSLINIRPRQNNRSMEIQDPKIKKEVERVIRKLLES
jgi:hypothetical protein